MMLMIMLQDLSLKITKKRTNMMLVEVVALKEKVVVLHVLGKGLVDSNSGIRH